MPLPFGTTVTLHDAGSRREHESWTQGTIRATLAAGTDGSAIHVVLCCAHKWDQDAPWGPYDGVPKVLARERNGNSELEFIDTWPRRKPSGAYFLTAADFMGGEPTQDPTLPRSLQHLDMEARKR